MRTMKITEVLRLQRNTTQAYQQSGFEERSGFGSRAGNRKSTQQKKARSPPSPGFELTLDYTNEAGLLLVIAAPPGLLRYAFRANDHPAAPFPNIRLVVCPPRPLVSK